MGWGYRDGIKGLVVQTHGKGRHGGCNGCSYILVGVMWIDVVNSPSAYITFLKSCMEYGRGKSEIQYAAHSRHFSAAFGLWDTSRKKRIHAVMGNYNRRGTGHIMDMCGE